MSFKHSFIGVAFAVFAFAGMATGAGAVVVGTVSGGLLENGETDVISSSVNGAFTHEWTFLLEGASGDPLASNSILDVILQNTNVNPNINIMGLTLNLFAGTPGGIETLIGPTIMVGSVPIPGPPITSPNSGSVMMPTLGSLSPGDYFFRITGTGIGSGGVNEGDDLGSYQVTVTATPLPAAIWLMISALLGLVSFARIRRSTSEAA